MDDRRRGGTGQGAAPQRVLSACGAVVAFLAFGICALFSALSAPTAQADLDDLLDSIVNAASAGVDHADTAFSTFSPEDAAAGAADLGVLDDPLSQVGQLAQDVSAHFPGAAADLDASTGSGAPAEETGAPEGLSFPDSAGADPLAAEGAGVADTDSLGDALTPQVPGGLGEGGFLFGDSGSGAADATSATGADEAAGATGVGDATGVGADNVAEPASAGTAAASNGSFLFGDGSGSTTEAGTTAEAGSTTGAGDAAAGTESGSAAATTPGAGAADGAGTGHAGGAEGTGAAPGHGESSGGSNGSGSSMPKFSMPSMPKGSSGGGGNSGGNSNARPANPPQNPPNPAQAGKELAGVLAALGGGRSLPAKP